MVTLGYTGVTRVGGDDNLPPKKESSKLGEVSQFLSVYMIHPNLC